MDKPLDQELRETQEALIHLTRLVSVGIQMATECALALADANMLPETRAQAVARSLRRAAELMDDPDEVEPGKLARRLHRDAARLDKGG